MANTPSTPAQMTGLAMPLDPSWLVNSRAFAHPDARVVRASIKLLMAAWSGRPAGTLPVSFASLADIAGMGEGEFQECANVLLDGWVMEGVRIVHPDMRALCDRIAARHADALSDFAAARAVAAHPEGEFSLVGEPTSKRKGKHRLPLEYPLTPEHQDLMQRRGILDPVDQQFVFDKFVSHYRKSGDMMVNWTAAFQNFVLRENLHQLPSATQGAGRPVRRFGSGLSRGDVIRESNASRFAAVGA